MSVSRYITARVDKYGLTMEIILKREEQHEAIKLDAENIQQQLEKYISQNIAPLKLTVKLSEVCDMIGTWFVSTYQDRDFTIKVTHKSDCGNHGAYLSYFKEEE